MCRLPAPIGERVRVGLTLAGALALVMLLVGLTLSGSPVLVAHTNGTLANGQIAETVSDAKACQAGEVLPAGISAIRLTLFSTAGPRVSVSALSGGRLITHGEVGSGWTGGSVTVPVAPVAHTTSAVRLCFGLGSTKEKVAIVGSLSKPAIALKTSGGAALPGRMKIEYLRAGHDSWWSLMQTVARRIGLGRAPSGAWVALLAALLMGAIVAGASWLLVRELG